LKLSTPDEIICSTAITLPSINSAPIIKAISLELLSIGIPNENAKLFATFSIDNLETS
jgi:hypothetical protein